MGHNSTDRRPQLDSVVENSSSTMVWKLLTLLVLVSPGEMQASPVPDQQAKPEDRVFDQSAVLRALHDNMENRQVGDDFFNAMWANADVPAWNPSKRQVSDAFFNAMWANADVPAFNPSNRQIAVLRALYDNMENRQVGDDFFNAMWANADVPAFNPSN